MILLSICGKLGDGERRSFEYFFMFLWFEVIEQSGVFYFYDRVHLPPELLKHLLPFLHALESIAEAKLNQLLRSQWEGNHHNHIILEFLLFQDSQIALCLGVKDELIGEIISEDMFEPVEQRRVFESEVVVYCDLVDAGLVQYADVVEVYIILTCEFDLEAYRGLE